VCKSGLVCWRFTPYKNKLCTYHYREIRGKNLVAKKITSENLIRIPNNEVAFAGRADEYLSVRTRQIFAAASPRTGKKYLADPL
jgi:hypothetical protein